MKSKDLAQLLGVSPATISLLLNHKPGLSQTLRDRLTQQIIELGYGDMLTERSGMSKKKNRQSMEDRSRPSIVYLSYRSKGSEWEDMYAFYSGVQEGAQQEAQETDCNLLVIYRQSEDLAKAIRRAGDVLGLIVVCDGITDEILEELDALHLPYVFIDAFDPTRAVNAVNVDDRQSFYIIVEYLKKLGHRELGFVTSGFESDSAEERRISYRRALKDHKLRDHREYYFTAGQEKGPMDTTVLEEQFRSIEHMPTAVLAENDKEAVRTIMALRKVGYRVPEDVSVIGFDDNPISRVIDPQLTTVRSSRHRIGRECVALIMRLNRLAESDTVHVPMKISISTELVVRDSVKEPRE
ncbi:MAG: LacI family transcriptional regulator [Clostridiales bacterium]|nr:LacI family transcriptional regulator [Clostridiales bacterium]